MSERALSTERFVEQIMGMPVTLALRGALAHTSRSRDAWRDVMAELVSVDELFSTYRTDSPISQIARGDLDVDQGPDGLAEVLALAEAARTATGGAFDVWRDDGQGRRIFDPSGVVKGWAIDRAARSLERLDGTGWCLSGGGDMVCSAGPEDFPAWRVGIEDPSDPRRVLGVVELRDGGIATSGTAHRGSHIRDARDGAIPHGVASVSVMADSLTRADVEATCGYLMGANAAEWLRWRPIRTAVVARGDGSVCQVAGDRGQPVYD